MKRLSLALISLLTLLPSWAQEALDSELLRQARADIQVLCSDSLAGRGYQEQGHQRAADYLSQRFEEIGLEAVIFQEETGQWGYQQDFSLNINLISDARLVLDQDTLKLGPDFIPFRLSGQGSGRYKIKDVGYGLKDNSRIEGKIALVRDGWPEDLAGDRMAQDKYGNRKQMVGRIDALLAFEPAGFIILQEKLTAAFAREHLQVPILEVLPEAYGRKHKRASFSVDAQLSAIETQNVIGLVRGTQFPDTAIVISAHYDHLGKMGSAIFPGANDNASGVAMLLAMAQHFAANPLPQSVLFVAFGGEETGLNGSRYYVEQDPVFPLYRTKFVLNLDLMGNGDEGITAVGGTDFPAYFTPLQALNDSINAVPSVRARRNAPNSDHFFFLVNGVPGFFIYTLGGPPHYHDVNDTPEQLRLIKFRQVLDLLIRFLRSL